MQCTVGGRQTLNSSCAEHTSPNDYLIIPLKATSEGFSSDLFFASFMQLFSWYREYLEKSNVHITRLCDFAYANVDGYF
jgi:hypothetical protein